MGKPTAPVVGIDLGHRLKEHLYKMLFNNFRNEISYQIEDVWGGYFDRLVTAQDTAMKQQQTALATAERDQKEYERRVERAFAVLNFFCSLTLTWFGGHLQYRVGNNYFKRTDFIPKDSIDAQGNWVSKYVQSEDKVAAKLFGHVGQDLAGALTDWGLPGVRTSKSFSPPNALALASSPTLETFRMNLKTEITNQKNQALGMVEEIANEIQNSPDYGDRLVAAILKEYPSVASEPLLAQQLKGQQVINSWLNGEREKWARGKKWLYYGNDPPKKADWVLIKRMEKELWVLWLLENKKTIWSSMTDINAERAQWFESIIDHVWYLDLPVMEIITKRGTNREPQISRLIIWAYKHKPENVAEGAVKSRTLTPIETWTRPH